MMQPTFYTGRSAGQDEKRFPAAEMRWLWKIAGASIDFRKTGNDDIRRYQNNSGKQSR